MDTLINFGISLSQTGLHLLFPDPGIGGKPNPAPPHVLPIDRRVGAKVRKKGARLQPQYLTQLSATQPGYRVSDQMDQGLLQVAMLREESPLMPPQANGVELSDLRQGVVATVAVIAGAGAPSL